VALVWWTLVHSPSFLPLLAWESLSAEDGGIASMDRRARVLADGLDAILPH
jgi:hypothetical protein